MRRSICYCEPNNVLAGQVSTWKFIYIPSTLLPKGSLIRFDFLSQNRQSDWEIPSANLNEARNVIFAHIEDLLVPCSEVKSKNQKVPVFDFILPSELKPGASFIITVGAPPERINDSKNGNQAQTFTQRRRSFQLSIDPKGKQDFKEHEIFNIDIKGNTLHNIRILTPSIVSKNKRFDVVVRFEDIHGNLTSNAPQGTLIELSYEHLRENLNWKLFVPETGFLTLPNLYFNEPGLYKIQLHNTQNKTKFYSQPIKCFAQVNHSLFWGLLRGESNKIDASTNIETTLRVFRDEEALQFFSSSNLENIDVTSAENWKQVSNFIAEFNEDYRFSTFLGFDWEGEKELEGLRQMIHSKDHKPLPRKKEAKTNSLKKVYRSFPQKELISIPYATMAHNHYYNFADFSEETERVVEIYNPLGSSECLKEEGNPKPIRNLSKQGITENKEGSIQLALKRNKRFGFVAGGIDKKGALAYLSEQDQHFYTSGLTAILATEQTRECLFQSLYDRHCYATTGEKIILGFNIAGAVMGSELSTKTKPGLFINRHITSYVSSPSEIHEVHIVRNGVVIKVYEPKEHSFEFTFDDTDPLSGFLLPTENEKDPFVYYYLRVILKNSHMAWSSPIWIDCPDAKEAPLEVSVPKKVKKQEKPLKLKN
ncbi:MAG: DUF3604 domain-containing protein [Rhabdochlamydiaceae bacterium]